MVELWLWLAPSDKPLIISRILLLMRLSCHCLYGDGDLCRRVVVRYLCGRVVAESSCMRSLWGRLLAMRVIGVNCKIMVSGHAY